MNFLRNLAIKILLLLVDRRRQRKEIRVYDEQEIRVFFNGVECTEMNWELGETKEYRP